MDPAAAKQQIVERVKQASRFLVTVNANPTVDQLAACIGLTLLLNKMNKHATAVFSGQVPSTIEFLQPEKTLEPNPDSLRDFIISLDKNKADKLRYKVEDDVVRIYITPYRTSLSEKDFVFSEGDFNVEVVIALGVATRASLDSSITAHGRILHDATVISLNAGQGKAPDLGQINWQDPQASSLSEMLVSISEAFGGGLIDAQTATAFLTGIVSETNRFGNKKTTPKVMTMSAQLMAAGANQQLIVQKLEPPAPPPLPPPPKAPPPPPREPKKPKGPPLKPEGVIDVPKDDKSKGKVDIDLGTTEIHIDEQGNISTQNQLLNQLPEPPKVEEPAPEPPKPVEPSEPLPPPVPMPAKPLESSEPPSTHAFMGTSAQPADSEEPFGASAGQPEWASPYEMVPMDPMKDENGPNDGMPGPSLTSAQGRTIQPPDSIPAPVTPLNSPLDSARSAVEDALTKTSSDTPLPPVQALNAQPLSEYLHSEVKEETVSPLPQPTTDTPSLTLPLNGAAQMTTTPPPLPPVPPMDSPPAPPPGPPPLMAAPGAVIPTVQPPQQ